jgi:hypothetical protein
MRTIALNRLAHTSRGGLCRVGVFACALLCTLLSATESDSPYKQIAKLASSLSDGEAIGALEIFDKGNPRYGAIAEEIQGLASQTEILCSIDVVEDKEADQASSEIHHLDLDWFMMLKSRAGSGQVERRRIRVAATLQLFKSKSGAAVWRITSLTPEQILAPLAVK